MATSHVSRLLEDWSAPWSFRDIEKLLSLCTDDGIYENVTMGVVNRGKAEVKQFVGAVFGAFHDFTIELTSRFIARD